MYKSGVNRIQARRLRLWGVGRLDDAGRQAARSLVFPESVGVGEYTYKRAQMLGGGFNAFVVDVYWQYARHFRNLRSRNDETRH